MTTFPYRLVESPLPAMGLIVLRVDETIETEFRSFLPPDVARLYVTRVQSGDDLTPDSIAGMEANLGTAASLLPSAGGYDVVGYACTSGTAQIGEESVRDLVTAGVKTRHVTNPLTAALAAFENLGLTRVGIVSPYVASVAEPLRATFVSRGIAIPDMLSFGEEVEARVARIDPKSIVEAARALAGRSEMDAVFLSCTNLQTRDILGPLTEELGMPVLSSNRALAWHMARLAGIDSEPVFKTQ